MVIFAFTRAGVRCKSINYDGFRCNQQRDYKLSEVQMQFLRSNYLYLILPALALVFVRVFFGIDGLYGQDAYEYLRFTKEISVFWQGGTMPLDFFWPVGYPFWGAVVTFIAGSPEAALQLVSMFSLVGTLVYLNQILKVHALNTNYISFYLIAFVMLSPLVFRSSMICMSDMLCTFFVVAHIAHYFKYTSDHKSTDLFLLVFFAVSAVFTRYGAAVIISVTAVAAAIHFLRNFKWSGVIVGTVGLFLALLPHLVFTNSGFFHFTKHQWLSDWNIMNLFRSAFVTNDGNTVFAMPNLVFYLVDVCHPRFFGPLIPLIVFAIVKKIKLSNRMLLVPAALYLLFIAGMPTQNTRFLLPIVPLLAVVFFPVFESIVSVISFKRIAFVGIVLVQVILVSFGFQSLYERMNLEQEVMATLNSEYPGRNLYSFDLDVAVHGRGYSGNVRSMYDSVYSEFNSGDLILFNVSRFEVQWKGRSPMQNWEVLNSQYTLLERELFRDGWKLYEVR